MLLSDELGHGWRALWTAQRTWLSLSAGQGWPLETQDLAAPVGGGFVSPSPLFDALALPLRGFLGPVSAFDTLAVAHLLLGALGGYALGRQVGLRGGAVVSGTVFGFNSLILSAGAGGGAPEVLGMAWVPVALAALCWLLRSPSAGAALATALSAVCMGLADPHLALFAPLLAPILVAPWLVERALRLRDAPGSLALSVGWVALAVGLAALTLGRALSHSFTVLQLPGALLPPGSLSPAPVATPDAMGGVSTSFATLSGLLFPSESNTLRDHGAATTTMVLYAGWISLTLAAIGARVGRLRWLVLSLVSVTLAMGPYLLITPDGWRPVPVAWWSWLAQTWPQYGLIQSFVRALGFGFAGLAVLAGAGAEVLADRMAGARRWIGATIPTLASAAIITEILALSPIPLPLPSAAVWLPQAVTRAADLPRAGAVLDWPQREGSAVDEIPRYLYYQLWHRRPIFTDLASGAGPTGIESNPFFAALERVTYGEGYRSRSWGEASAMPLSEGVSAIAGMGYAYLVLHPVHLAPDRRQAVESWLGERLALVERMEDGSAIFALRARPEPPTDAQAP